MTIFWILGHIVGSASTISVDNAAHAHGSTTYDELMRAQWIGADIDLAWRVRVSKEAFAFATERSYVVVEENGATVALADSFHDYGGQRVLWSTVAVDQNGTVLRLWNAATWGGSSAWYYAVGAGDAHTLANGPTVAPYTRPGLVMSADAGVFGVFTVDASGALRYASLAIYGETATWLSDVAALTLPHTYTSLAVCPLTPNKVFILGLKGTLFFAQLHMFSEGSWASGTWTPLVHNAGLNWVDGLNGNAAEIGATDALVVPVGPDGQNMIVTHTLMNTDLASGIYSTPHFILASPQQDMGRKVWVNAISLLNGRLWATVWNALEGDPGHLYARHLSLLSSSDGVRWRDEGFISQLDVRGVLCQVGTELWLASPTTVLTMPALARFATPAADASTWLTDVSSLAVTHGGQRATAELRVTAQPGATLDIAPGMRIEYDLGSRVGTDAQNEPIYAFARQFTGYVDRPVLERVLGVAGEEWLCRGVLGSMIGESAYRPPTMLWFPGRRTWNTHFLEFGEPVDALAAMSGYWLATKVPALPPIAEHAYLACGGSGNAVVPQDWTWPDLVYTVEFTTPKGLGLLFWDAAEDATYGQNCFELLLDGATLSLQQRQAGVATLLASEIMFDYLLGDRVRLTLFLGAGKVGVTFIDKNGTMFRYDFSAFLPANAAPPALWRVGIHGDVDTKTFTGTGLDDLVLYVPITDESHRVYCVEITEADATDKYRWGYCESSDWLSLDLTWTWIESDLEISDYEYTLDNDIVISFRAKTGHTVGDRWTFGYPQPAAKIYEVLVCGGDDPVTVGSVLTTCAEIARVPVELPPASTYMVNAENVYPFQTYIEGEIGVPAGGASLQIFDEQHVLLIGTDYAEFAGQRQGYPALSWPTVMRLVGNANVLSLHHGGHVLAAWYYDIASDSGRIIPDAGPTTGTTYTVPALAMPIDEAQWDYNQPASSVLELVLNRRRIYLYDDPDGKLRVTNNPERALSIDGSSPVGGHVAYERAVSRVVRARDARDIIGLIQIIGDGSPGSRVAMLDPTAAQYGARTATQDNPWVHTETDALLEARLALNDSQRALEIREVEGFWDPALRLGGVFDLEIDGATWTGIVQEYGHELTIDDQAIHHTAHWTAQQKLTISAYGKWVVNNNATIVAPPQTTPSKTKYNQARWR